jgi:hypothetical protein
MRNTNNEMNISHVLVALRSFLRLAIPTCTRYCRFTNLNPHGRFWGVRVCRDCQ